MSTQERKPLYRRKRWVTHHFFGDRAESGQVKNVHINGEPHYEVEYFRTGVTVYAAESELTPGPKRRKRRKRS